MTTQRQESDNKAAFIQRVREALGRSEPVLHTPDHPALKTTPARHEEKVRTIHAKVEARRSRLLDVLAETAESAGWHVHLVETNEEAASAVGDIARRLEARSVVRSAEEIFDRVDVDASLRRVGVSPIVLASGRGRRREELKRIAFEADLGVTGVTYAIAETASCVITPRRGVARITSLAPPAYVALVEARQVLESLDDYFVLARADYLRQRGRAPTYTNFISGPSRTADIEQTLTIGVHGPGEVHMVLIG